MLDLLYVIILIPWKGQVRRRCDAMVTLEQKALCMNLCDKRVKRAECPYNVGDEVRASWIPQRSIGMTTTLSIFP